MTSPQPGAGGATDGPTTKSTQAAMAAAGVDAVSKMHPLFGKTVTIGDYFDKLLDQLFEGGPAEIIYAVGDLFVARMASGRQPSGAISAIKTAEDGTLSYSFPEGA